LTGRRPVTLEVAEDTRPIETTQIAQSHDPHIGEALIYMAILILISETQSCACNFVIAAI
jgi:hypothetical protein